MNFMKWQNKIIVGCYVYILGIVLAMLCPVAPTWLPGLRIGAALGLGLAVVLLVRGSMQSTKAAPSVRLIWVALCLGALLLGYTRYTSANTVPDMAIGNIHVGTADAVFEATAELTDTSRLRLIKQQEIEGDIRLRIHGELAARTPVLNADGHHQMTATGEWQFNLARMPIHSEEIVIAADDPVGTAYTIEQPFNRIERVERTGGAGSGTLSVYRISNHIGSFVGPARAQSPVTVLGRITSDPRVYDFQTVLMVTPAYIQYPAGGPFYRVEGGDVQVTINPRMTGYEELAQTAAYGADVEIQAELTVAGAAANPGGFDARQFMQNYNIYGLMRPFQARNEPPPMNLITPAGRDAPRSGHWLVSFSLDLRDRVLLIFKSTMPYPQSAFLGGVTLGLRYGLQGTQFPGEAERGIWATRLGLGRSESTIVDDFRYSGVNHVLAVSGLHVTILTVMFVAIFALMKFPKQVFVPFVIFALVVFAIITGARPSTLRAVIMNSLFLLTWGYLDKGLLSSVLIGVPVAAFLILIHNPLVAVDPSFTLSFGAILSLALITMPTHDILSTLRGNRFLVVILFVVATTLIGIIHWPLITTPSFIVLWLVLAVVVYQFARHMEARGYALSSRFAFSALPEGVSTFIAAQVAIQVGMMIPLSAFYFSRWPFAGAYANLIAIPLIGVVVQLGAIAGLLGLIPVAGPYIALLLSAANWVFASFFLWLAHVSSLIFPYPYVRRPRVIEIVVYYLFIGAFIWHKPLWKSLQSFCRRRGWSHRQAPALLALGLALLATVPLWLAPPRDTRDPGLHLTVFSAGYGGAMLLESPGGRRILIDTGFVEHERGRRNQAERTILPYFSHAAIRELDALILTSPLPERAAGAAYVLEQMRVQTLFLPPVLGSLQPDWTFADFQHHLGIRTAPQPGYPIERQEQMYHELVGHPEWPRRPSLAKAIQSRGPSLMNRWSGKAMQVETLSAGTVLFAEETDGQPFRIEVLGPTLPLLAAHPVENNSVSLRIVHGDVAILIPGPLHLQGQARLAQQLRDAGLHAQVLVAPHQGTVNIDQWRTADARDIEPALRQHTGPLLEAAQPEIAIFEFNAPGPVLQEAHTTARHTYNISKQFYQKMIPDIQIFSTDSDQAILIHSDGRTATVDTQAARNRASGGEEDAVSDLSVGL
jgi:ComEC/Rec2-related protein